MNPIITYSLEVVIASLILGSCYFIFFKNLTLFRFNRFYLLSAMVLPFVLPLIQVPVITNTPLPNISILLDEVTVGAQVTSIEQTSSLSGLQWFYLIIASVILIRIIIGIISILSIFNKAKKQQIEDLLLYVSPKNVNPFSVFKRIVVSTTTYQNKQTLSRILIHEQAHINQHHSIDSFLAEIICALFWFNPMVWILKKELKSTHEYLADEKVLEQDFDLADYFMLIFNNTIGQNVELANNFNQSLNLKRMKMMKKKRSSRFAKMMSIIAVPVLIGATIMLTSQCTNTGDSNTETTSAVNTEIAVKKAEIVNLAPGEKRFMVIKKAAQFPGGSDALMKYFRTNVGYPAEAQKFGIQGRVIVEFTIDENGKVKDVTGLKVDLSKDKVINEEKSTSNRLNKAVWVVSHKPEVEPEIEQPTASRSARILSAEAVRVVSNMPDWEPGTERGKKVSVSYSLPINFTMK